MKGRGVPALFSARERCPARPGAGGEGRGERGALSPSAGPGLDPPSAITPSARPGHGLSTRIAKAETRGCQGGPGLPAPHCRIPSRLLLMLFTRAEFGMARASPHPSSFVPFISAGRWISL